MSEIADLSKVPFDIYQGLEQNKIIREAQDEARKMAVDELAREKENTKYNRRIAGRNYEDQKRQIEINRRQEDSATAYQRLQNQFSMFSDLLNQNESLKDLFINRIAGLRR